MSFDQEDRRVLQDVICSTIVPADSAARLDNILQSHPDIDQRSTLYFGMHYYASLVNLYLTHH